MKKSNVETLKSWINSRSGIKTADAEPTSQTPVLSSKQRNTIKWKSKNNR